MGLHGRLLAIALALLMLAPSVGAAPGAGGPEVAIQGIVAARLPVGLHDSPSAPAIAVSSPPSARGFLENIGQSDGGSVRYYAAGAGGGVSLLDGGVVITLPSDPSPDGQTAPSAAPTVLRLSFVGASDRVPIGRHPLPGVLNYFIGPDPTRWATGVRAFAEVAYEDLWDGIDLVYRTDALGRLKYDLVVRPGADPADIWITVDGCHGLVIAPTGGLVASAPGPFLREDAPLAFEDGEGGRVVACAFELRGERTYGFAVGERDPASTLVIDPLVNSTFFGGTGLEDSRSVALDADGSVLITGYTRSPDLPTTDGVIQQDPSGGSDAYVAKFDANLSTLLFCTYLGGSSWDYGCEVAVEDDGGLCLAGVTMSTNFPVTTGAFQPALAGGWDVFVSKLSSDGTGLQRSTYLGGSGKDYAFYLLDIGMAVDADGSVYVASSTDSIDFPTTTGAFQETRAGGEDAYVSKLSADLGTLEYSTMVGGEDFDYAYDVAVDSDGVAYICGQTSSTDLPTTVGAYQEDPTGDFADAFVGAVSADGSSMAYLTYLGGWASDSAAALWVDGEGSAHVHGTTDSVDFPVTEGVLQTAKADMGDLFVTELDPDGSDIERSTFMGGDAVDEAGDITGDPLGDVYVCGRTGSSDFPTTPGCDQSVARGSYEGYMALLSANLSKAFYSTYLGGTGIDVPYSVAFDGAASVYVAGFTTSSGFPTTPGSYQGTYLGGNGDGFVTRYVIDAIPPTADAGPDVTIDQHETIAFDGTGSWDNLGIVDFTWTFTYDGAPVELSGPTPSFTFDTVGTYVVNLTVRDGVGNAALAHMTVTVLDITPPAARAGEDVAIDQRQTAVLDGTGSRDNVGIVSYRWAFTYLGGDVVLLGPTTTFTFLEAGVFEVELNVSDAAGNWATDNVTVRVRDVTAPFADAGRDQVVDQNTTVSFNGSGSRDNVAVVNWTWTFSNDGAEVALFGAAPSFVFVRPGVYTVLLTVKDADGNAGTDSAVVEVRDTERPVADAGPDVAIDQDRTVVLNATASSDNVGITSYRWSFEYDGALISLDGPTPNFFFHAAGRYSIMLTVTDRAGNWASDLVTVTVRDVARPLADAGADVTVDQHEAVSLDGSSSWDNSGVVSWSWNLTYRGGGIVLEGARTTFIFDDAGLYVVDLTVSDAAGNDDTDSMTVTVRDTTPPIAVAGKDVWIPQGATVRLNGSASTDNVGIASWVWVFSVAGSPVDLAGAVATYVFSVPGVYLVTLTVQDVAHNAGTGTLTVHVNDTLAPVAVAPANMRASVGEWVTFNGSGSTDNVGIVNYTWTIKLEGASYAQVLIGPVASYSFDQPGTQRVTLTVTDAQGNTDSATFTVTVEGRASWWWLLIPIVIAAVVVAFLLGRRRKAREGARGK